jgi:hypothetical protein
MSKWWYITLFRCTTCGARRKEYDHTAPWCDSGLSSPPTIETICEECFDDLREAETDENLC